MSNFLKVTGKLFSKTEIKTVNPQFVRREFIVEVNSLCEKYKQHLCFVLTQSRVHIISQFEIGDEIEVSFYAKGKLVNGRALNNLEVYSVALLGEHGINYNRA
jgi:hypothetical protein